MIRPAGFFSLTSPLPWALSLTLHAGAAVILLGDSSVTGWLTPVTSKSGEIQFTVAPRAPTVSRAPRNRSTQNPRRRTRSPPLPRGEAEPIAATSDAAPAPTAHLSDDVLRDYADRARLRIQSELEDLDDINKLPSQGLQLKLWLAHDGAVERFEISGEHEALDEDSLKKIREKVNQAAPFEALPVGIPRLALKVPLKAKTERR